MKNPLSRELFGWLNWYQRDACADDEALYVQRGNQYFKLAPTVVHATEYSEAWDRAQNLPTSLYHSPEECTLCSKVKK